MIGKLAFDELVEAVEGLSTEDQTELVHLLQRRLAERERRRVVADVAEARAEMASGQARLLDLVDLSQDLRD